MNDASPLTAQLVRSPAQRNEAALDATPREQLLSFMPVTERRLTLAGISTAVLEGGEGSPVILLHGPSGYAAHWLRIIPNLTTTHRVIAPDLPGHGATDGDASLGIDRIVAWVDELIEKTCPSQPTIVGQLLGGAIAIRVAAERRGRLARLVLVDTFGLSEFRPAPAFARALTDFLSDPREATHGKLWRYCAFDLDRLRQQMGAHWQPFERYNVERAARPCGIANVSSLMATFGIPAISPADLARIEVPTSLIWGRHDLATPLAIAAAACARYGWALQIIEEAADDPAIEQPEAFLRALRAALAST